ncbi:hypothetical protein SEA_FRANCOIS_2 [Gordonia phage Francois]|nr:hypothetical protein SEA_FRANCOIS_2 [Gordonia phage Francois]
MSDGAIVPDMERFEAWVAERNAGTERFLELLFSTSGEPVPYRYQRSCDD